MSLALKSRLEELLPEALSEVGVELEDDDLDEVVERLHDELEDSFVLDSEEAD